MAKIETITPVHIGDGNTFFAVKKDGYMYYLDEIFERFQPKYESLKKLTTLNNPSSDDLINTLLIPKEVFNPKYAISQNLDYGKYAKDKGNISCCQKALDKPIIPGSSLKGAFVNIFWYYVIKKNNAIKNYLINNHDIKKSVTALENAAKSLRTYLRIRDVNLNCDTVIYEVNRYQKSEKSNNGIILCGNVEAINHNESYEGELLLKLKPEEKKHLNDLKEEIINNQKEFIFKDFINELYNYIINFETIFPQYNKEFMKEVITKELSYVNEITSSKVNIKYLNEFYQDILKRLDNDEIILQIGKFTNYIDKSFVIALGKYYNENFEKFTPNRKKKVPTIDTMNLTTINGVGKVPLGFIKVEF